MNSSLKYTKGSLKILIISLFVLISVSAIQALQSAVFSYDEKNVAVNTTGWSHVMLKSPSRSLDMFGIEVNALLPGKGLPAHTVEAGSDEMLIIKEGSAELILSSRTVHLTKGSVAVIPQGDRILLKNSGNEKVVWYSFMFRTGVKSAKKVSPFIVVWDTVKFLPSANGGRRNIINQGTSALKNLEIHVTTLKEGLPSHASHVHPDEEIILLRNGIAEELINGVAHKAPAGSAIFISNDDDHGIKNSGKGECEYYAIRWITGTTPATK